MRMEIRDEDFDNVNPGELRFLLQEGRYPAQYNGYEAKHYGRWGEKLIFQWKVFTSIDRDKFQMLCRYYNITRDKGGRFKFGPLHDYRKDWIAANGGKILSDRSRLPLSIFRDKTFLVEVVTVKDDFKCRLSPSLYWSKIRRVIRPLADEDRLEGSPVQPPNSSE